MSAIRKSAALPLAAVVGTAARVAAPHMARSAARTASIQAAKKINEPTEARGTTVVKNKLGGNNQPDKPERSGELPESPKPVNLTKSAQRRLHKTYGDMRQMEKEAAAWFAAPLLGAGLGLAGAALTGAASLGVAGALAAGGAAKTVGVHGARKLYQTATTESVWDRLLQRRPEWANNRKAREHFEVLQKFSPDIASNITTAESYVDRSMRTSQVPHEFVKDLTGIQKTRSEGGMSQEFLRQRLDLGSASTFTKNVQTAGQMGGGLGSGLARSYSKDMGQTKSGPANVPAGSQGQLPGPSSAARHIANLPAVGSPATVNNP